MIPSSCKRRAGQIRRASRVARKSTSGRLVPSLEELRLNEDKMMRLSSRNSHLCDNIDVAIQDFWNPPTSREWSYNRYQLTIALAGILTVFPVY